MAETKSQHYWIAGLIALAAVAVIYLLHKEGLSTQPTSTGPPDIGQEIPPYPNAQPLDLPTVSTVDGSSPNTAYNTPGRPGNLQVTDPWDTGGCSCDKANDCSETSTLQSRQKIAPDVLDGSISNINSYQEKVTSGVEAARATFGLLKTAA